MRVTTVVSAAAMFLVPIVCSCEGSCDVWLGDAVVSGRVSASDSGAPIIDAPIEVTILTGCGGQPDGTTPERTTTDSNGMYSVKLRMPNTNGVFCVRVMETNSGRLADDEVEFVGGCDNTRPPGRVTIDLVI